MKRILLSLFLALCIAAPPVDAVTIFRLRLQSAVPGLPGPPTFEVSGSDTIATWEVGPNATGYLVTWGQGETTNATDDPVSTPTYTVNTLDQFWICVKSTNSVGTSAAQCGQNEPGDPPTPGAPGVPQFVIDGAETDVTWTASDPAADSYLVTWGDEDGTVVNNDPAPSNAYTVPRITPIWLCVTGINTSGSSSFICASHDPTSPPGSSVTLEWNASTGTVSGYRVYYGTAPGTYDQSPGNGISAGTNLELELTGLAPDTYYAVVRAFNTSGESGDSNEVSFEIQ